MRRLFDYLLPIFGAAGFAIFSELSLRRPTHEFFLWSLVTAAWILLVFFAIFIRRPRKRLLRLAVPAVLMISISTIVSLLFLDLVSPRHFSVAFFGVALYLFYEHVRREVAAPDQEERLTISEFARMINIGSLFLIVSVAIGVTDFLSVSIWATLLPICAMAAIWSWHLFWQCVEDCPRPRSRAIITVAVVLQTYLVVLRLPTSMFVGGAVVGIVYYLCANLLPRGLAEPVSPRLIRRYAIVAVLMLLLVLATARWV